MARTPATVDTSAASTHVVHEPPLSDPAGPSRATSGAPAALAGDPFVQVYHELRSPLGLLQTTALSAASDCPEGSPARRRLETISRVAERTLRVTESVLSLARDSQADSAAGEGFHPAELLRGLVEDLAGSGATPPQLEIGGGANEAVLPGHAPFFEGMAQALLTNAYDHGDGEAPRLHLDMSDDTLTLTVRNTVAPNGSHHGLGIGTYLALQFATGLGGTLTTAREQDEFSARFIVQVPPQQQPSNGARRTNGSRL